MPKDHNNPRTVYGALRAVAEAWKPGDPPIAAWTDGIEDPRLRNFAKHAWLSVLAEKDPKAALAALPAAELGSDNGLDEDAALEIASQLAKTDLPEAFKLMKEMESYFSQHPADNDPFSEAPAEDRGGRSPGIHSPVSPRVTQTGPPTTGCNPRFSLRR